MRTMSNQNKNVIHQIFLFLIYSTSKVFFPTHFPTTYMSPEWNWSRCLLCCSRGPTVALHRPTWLSDVGTYPSLKKSKECVNMQHLAPHTRRTVNLNRMDFPYTCMFIPALQQPADSLLFTSLLFTSSISTQVLKHRCDWQIDIHLHWTPYSLIFDCGALILMQIPSSILTQVKIW